MVALVHTEYFKQVNFTDAVNMMMIEHKVQKYLTNYMFLSYEKVPTLVKEKKKN